jgi:trigger factor
VQEIGSSSLPAPTAGPPGSGGGRTSLTVVKATKEALSPTRVRLTVEVPFDELKPSVDAAYKKIARQVRVAGFRPGRVPPRVLDQRVGRGVVLDEALQEAVPRFYTEAVRVEEVEALSRPEVDVTGFGDGEPLVFTAEVDVRPEVVLPDYDGIEITVDDADVTDEEVERQLEVMRDRFAVLQPAGRAVQTGDFVSLDLSAAVDGEPLPDAEGRGITYEVGSGGLVPGIDEALAGAEEGETRAFQTELMAGEHAGRTAEVSATVRSVKTRQRPELDDDFATTASEFDTLAELTADVRIRIERVKRLQQGMQARDRVLEELLARVQLPLPESVVEAEVEARQAAMARELEQLGATRETYLAAEGQTAEQFEAELQAGAASAVKAQFVLDSIVAKEQLSVDNAELSEEVVRRAQRIGASPEQYAQQLVSGNTLPVLMAEVVRAKALAAVLDRARISDASGRPIDLRALDRPPAATGEPAAGELPERGDADEVAPAATDPAPAPGRP